MKYQLSRPVTGVESAQAYQSAMAILGLTQEELTEFRKWKGDREREEQTAVPELRFDEALQRYVKERLPLLADSTQAKYRAHLSDHHEWLRNRFGREPLLGEITETTIVQYMNHRRMHRGGHGHKTRRSETSTAYRNQILGALQGVYGWFHRQGLARVDPTDQVKTESLHLPAPRHLSLPQAMTLLELARTKSRYSMRDYTIVALMLMTGARVEEVTLCRVGDIDFDKNEILLRGKGRNREKKLRTMPLAEGLRRVLENWVILGLGLQLDAIRTDPDVRSQFLFTTLTGGTRVPLSTANLRGMLNRLLDEMMYGKPKKDSQEEDRHQRVQQRRSGSRRVVAPEARHMPDQYTPHSLRHTFAFLALESNVDLVILQEWMGHVDINTTARYARLKTDEQRKRLEMHPLAKLVRRRGQSDEQPDG